MRARSDAPDRVLPGGVVGLLLAAGAGARFGGPKALARGEDGVPWVVDRVAALEQGGCTRVLVVLGARAHEARALLPSSAVPVLAGEWEQGLSASLRAGLRVAGALHDPAPVAALVALVDTPGLTAAAVHRLARLVRDDTSGAVLARATYGGRAGHPVLLGRRHWGAISDAAIGDRGAGPHLDAVGALRVECADVADGEDVDERPVPSAAPGSPATPPPGSPLSGPAKPESGEHGR